LSRKGFLPQGLAGECPSFKLSGGTASPALSPGSVREAAAERAGAAGAYGAVSATVQGTKRTSGHGSATVRVLAEGRADDNVVPMRTHQRAP
jgi:hypothetical protein